MCPVQPGGPRARTGWRRRHRRQDPGPGRCRGDGGHDTAAAAARGVKIWCHREIPRTGQPFRLRAQIRRHADGVMNDHNTRPGPRARGCRPGSRAIAAGLGSGPRPWPPSWFAAGGTPVLAAGSPAYPRQGSCANQISTWTKRSITGRYRGPVSVRGWARLPWWARRSGLSPGNPHDYGARSQTGLNATGMPHEDTEPASPRPKPARKSASCSGFTGSSARSKIMNACSPGIGPGPRLVECFGRAEYGVPRASCGMEQVAIR